MYISSYIWAFHIKTLLFFYIALYYFSLYFSTLFIYRENFLDSLYYFWILLCTNLPIKSIVQKCGIPDVYYFARLFKRIMGTTPKIFRQNVPHEVHSDLPARKKQ
ncbi:AraC family transcriptional regulator [Schaedlerella sp.]|uniref:AraC family transcriptional regulator n=1 Tax=Schaedlerella sp. TaxID=2676057 RepID=UPI0037461420